MRLLLSESMYLKYTDHRRDFTSKERLAFDRMNAMSWKRDMVCGIPSFDKYSTKENQG